MIQLKQLLKQLTICQPYAHLIMTGRKRVENRTWATSYRGPLLIHAGKSRQWLQMNDSGMSDEYGIRIADMAFGAIVGICELIDCVKIALPKQPELRKRDLQALPPHLAWMRGHEHTEGPHCLVLDNVRRLKTPIPCRGALGLLDVSPDLLAGQELIPIGGHQP